MSWRMIRSRICLLIVINFMMLSAADLSIEKTKAQEPDPIQSYLPIVFGPDQITYILSTMDMSRFSEVASQLVNGYGPRHHDRYRVFIDRSCTLGGVAYPNSNLIRSSNYIQEYFELLGYPVTREYVGDGTGGYNIVATKTGNIYSNVFIEIGAHIDTKTTTPGASDNAAAVAAMLELATVLKDYNSRYSLRFISFVGEEYHLVNNIAYSLTGSRYHVSQIAASNQKIKAGLIMDGIGWSEAYPELMNCIWDNGSIEGRRIANLFSSVRSAYDLDINWRRCSPYLLDQVSDNVSYWERNFSAVLSIGGLPYLDPNYHACTDDMLAVNLLNAFVTAQQNLVVLLTLDNEPWIYSTPPDYQQTPSFLWQGNGH